MFKLPDLPYPNDALEPYIDAKTMELHYGKHHATYVSKLNAAIEEFPDLYDMRIEELLSGLDTLPESVSGVVRNNGGGHFNHSVFWTLMSPDGGGEPGGALAQAIKKSFGEFGNFKNEFSKAAAGIFGSGWAWLMADGDGELTIKTFPNQDSPIMSGQTGVMALDVWEHAYYLKYQNRRPEYIDSWWNVVNWEQVEKNYDTKKPLG